jgi:parallel beta-helix repeat protein
MAQTLYVNPATGSDSAAGSQSAPFKTITKALKQAQSDTQIQLAAGNYNAANGEVFPLEVASGVTVVGNEANKGSGILIEGSGKYTSRTFAEQNVTFLLANNAQLRGVTVTNPASRGTAAWVESTAPTIANCTFTKSKREGVLATGDAKPVILNSVFIQNDGNGIAMTKNSSGEIRGNTCTKGGYGIAIDASAAPLVVDNKISDNRFGIGVSVDARPVLRNNVIENNSDYGLTVTGKALPDLGSSKDPGKNILRNNGQFDLLNSTNVKLVSVGNELKGSKVSGPVEIDGKDAGGKDPDDDKDPKKELTDIKGHWAESFIQALYDKGLISGFSDGTFKPDAKMTRAQYAALLVKAFNPQPKRDAGKFSDIAADFWAKDVIQQAYRGQFLSGFPNNTFRPNENVQRVQVIVSLVSGLGIGSSDTTALSAYDDRNTIPDYAKDEVATATKKQIVINHPNLKQLNPAKDATRAEVAAMVYQTLVDAKQVSAINSPFIVSFNSDGENPTEEFADIKGHWAEPFIRGLLNQGLITGYSDGTFKPDAKVNRAQYAALVVKAFNPQPKRDAGKFNDIAADFWAKDAIQQAYRGQFMSGVTSNTFRPNENIQRVQVIVSLVSGLGLSASDANALNAYDDRSAIPDYAKDEVTTATKKKIVVSHPQTKQLNPTREATRAEVAAMVYQALVDAKQLSAVNSPYIVSA